MAGGLFLDAWDLGPDGVFYAVVDDRPGENIDTAFLVAADTNENRELWCLRLPRGLLPTQVLRAPNGPVLAYHPGVAILACDPLTGKRLWRRRAPEPNLYPAPHSEGGWGAGVLARTSEEVRMLTPTELAVIDPADGEQRWSVRVQGRGGYYHGYAPPVDTAGIVAAIVDWEDSFRRRLIAISKKGRCVLWETDLGNMWDVREATDSLGGCDVSAGAVVCLRDAVEDASLTLAEREVLEKPRPRLACFDLQTGHERWQRELAGWPHFSLGEHPTPTACGEFVLVRVRHRSKQESDRCLVYSLTDGAFVRDIPDVDTRPVELGGAVAWSDDDKGVVIARAPSFEVVARVDLSHIGADFWICDLRALWGRVVVVSPHDENGGRAVTYVAVVGREP